MTRMSPLTAPSSDRIGDAAICSLTVLPRRFSADRLIMDVLCSAAPARTPQPRHDLGRRQPDVQGQEVPGLGFLGA